MPDRDAIAALATEGIEVLGPVGPKYDEILTPEALRFVASLQRTFGARREELLALRVEAQKRIDAGVLPDFLPETEGIRRAGWTVAPIPPGLEDRRVEITGPVERKMVINALNSGASVFLADFEDANSPTWANCVEGHLNLRDAIDGTIGYTAPETGKEYRLNEKTAVLFVRPRGWHLLEKHLLVDGKPCSASLFDFGLFFFHCGKRLLAKGARPCFYLPKLEHHLEARRWNDVFVKAQQDLGLPVGTIRATVLIETILAAFQMDEILWELKDHSAGLNCGRWDYIFSFIKRLGRLPGYVLPDRGLVTMEKHFLASYVTLLIQTCHRRGIHAMGGMAAQIPIKNDPAANEAALAKVRADKLREVKAGHDGTWVAHPGLVPVAKTIFDELMPRPNQIATAHPAVTVTAAAQLPPAVDFAPASPPQWPPLLAGKTIAVANDAAFCFAYPANRECLIGMGARLVDFSPLADAALPECDAAWLPGGYPELHTGAIAANRPMAASLKAHVEAGKPLLAECGGMMALFDTLVSVDGAATPAFGLLPGETRMQKKLAALGLMDAELPEGRLSGHSFHYSTCTTPLEPLVRAEKRVGNTPGEPIYRQRRLTASYVHFYFPANPEATAKLLAK